MPKTTATIHPLTPRDVLSPRVRLIRVRDDVSSLIKDGYAADVKQLLVDQLAELKAEDLARGSNLTAEEIVAATSGAVA